MDRQSDFTRPRKVLIGPVEIAGFCAALSDGFSSMGWQSYTIDYQANRFKYKSRSGRSWVLRVLQRLFVLLAKLPSLPRRSWLLSPLYFPLQCIVFVWACFRCDAFIFIFGRSLLPFSLDLWVFKLLRKPVVAVYLGSDSRPPYLSGSWRAQSANLSPDQQVQATVNFMNNQRGNLRRMSRRSRCVVDNPYSGFLQPAPFVNWFSMGFPCPTPDLAMSGKGVSERPVILHAPSNRVIKGSEYIEKILDELRDEGVEFNYVALENRSNVEVIEILKQADILVDEMYSDTPLGGLGTEAGAQGCAVVVGGFGWEHVPRYIQPEMLPGSVCIKPEELKDTLRKLIKDPELCTSIGGELRTFIGERWGAAHVAERYAQLLFGDIPGEWLVDPDQLVYVGGMGAEPTDFDPLIKSLVKQKGYSTLGVKLGTPLDACIRSAFLEANDADNKHS